MAIAVLAVTAPFADIEHDVISESNLSPSVRAVLSGLDVVIGGSNTMLGENAARIAKVVVVGLSLVLGNPMMGSTALADEKPRILVSTLHEHTRGGGWIAAPTPQTFSPNGAEILLEFTPGSHGGGYDIHAVELMLRRPSECNDADARVEVELWMTILGAGIKFVNTASEPGEEFVIAKFVPEDGNAVRVNAYASHTFVVRTTSDTDLCLGMAIVESGSYENTSVRDWSMADTILLRKRYTNFFASRYGWGNTNARMRITGVVHASSADIARVEVGDSTGQAVSVARNGNEYEADVGANEAIKVRAFARDTKHATVKYYRNADEEIVDENPSSRALETRANPGRNVIDAVITAGDGETRNRYTIVINRDDPSGNVAPSEFDNALRLRVGTGWTGMTGTDREWRFKTTLNDGETYRVEARGARDKSLEVYDEQGTRLAHETADGIEWATFTYEAQSDVNLLVKVQGVSRIRVVTSDTAITTDEAILNRTDCNTDRNGANNCAGAIGDSRTGTIDSDEDVDGWPIYVNKPETYDIAVYPFGEHALTETRLRIEDPAKGAVIEKTASEGEIIRATLTAAAGSTRQIFIDLSGTPGESGAGEYALVVKRRIQYGLPRVRVTDAAAEEGEGAKLGFEIRMRRAATRTVRVDYETRSGTATEGVDFTNMRGQVLFTPGETSKMVEVPILDDEHDEGTETMSLVLSNVINADYERREGTGSITNGDALPREWAIRFGRTIARQASDAIAQRFDNAGRNSITIAGRTLDLGETRQEGTAEQEGEAAAWDAARQISWKDVARTSAFHLGNEGDGSGSHLTAWGRVSATRFEGGTGAGKIDGEVTSVFIAADARWGDAILGLMASRSRGSGGYRPEGTAEHDVESRVDTVYPYAHMQISQRTSMWATVGSGSGKMTVGIGKGMHETTDINLKMGAGNARHTLLGYDNPHALQIKIGADALWVETRTAKTRELDATRADAAQLRVSATAQKLYEMQDGTSVRPGIALGARSDHGDAETGRGLEARASLDIDAGRLSMSAQTSMLLTHSNEDYEECDAGASLRYDATKHGRGFDFSIAPKWAIARNRTNTLEAMNVGEGATGEYATSVTAQIGHTARLRNLKGTARPHAGATFAAGGGRSYELGVQWTMGGNASLGALATIGRPTGGEDEASVMIQASVRF